MKIKAWLAAAAMSVVCMGQVGAQERAPEINALFEATDDGSFQMFERWPKQNRAALAQALTKYYEYLNRRVPRVSPADAAWVQGEFDSVDGARISAVMDTPEFAKRELGYYIDNCRNIMADVAPAIGGPTVEEFYQWTRVLYCIDDPSRFFEHMTQAGHVQGVRDEWFDYGLGMWSTVKKKITDTIAITLREEGQ